MKIASLNRFLLAKFAHSETFGNDLESFFRRFRILCNIYANFGLLFIVGAYNIISGILAQNPDAFFMPLICFPLIGMSLYLLTKKYYNWSSIFLLLTMASGNLITTYNINSPIAALASTVLLPHFMFYSSSSGMIQILNLVICLGLHLYSSFEVSRIFEVTLSDEQALQINLLFLSTFLTLTTTSLFCIFHKSIEISIRRSTDLNFLNPFPAALLNKNTF